MGEMWGKDKVFDFGGIGCYDFWIRLLLFYRLIFVKKFYLSVRYCVVDLSVELIWEKE